VSFGSALCLRRSSRRQPRIRQPSISLSAVVFASVNRPRFQEKVIGHPSENNCHMRRTRLRPWRLAILWLCALVLLGVTVSSAYQLIAGHTIEARVLWCTNRDCEVAYNFEGHHGTDNTDAFGSVPGQYMKVTYVPGWGVTNRSSEIATLAIVLGGTAIGVVSYQIRRRRGANVRPLL
jgi:hypothetical protein